MAKPKTLNFNVVCEFIERPSLSLWERVARPTVSRWARSRQRRRVRVKKNHDLPLIPAFFQREKETFKKLAHGVNK